MKKKITLLMLLLILFVSNILYSQVYTTTEKAETLAILLDKGEVNGFKIRAIFAVNNEKGVYLVVTLSNGETENWYLDTLFELTKKNTLLLRGNKVIIFNPADLNNFRIFNKNDFNRIAINAKIFKDINPQGSLLEGITFHYYIKSFDLLDAKKNKYFTDKIGYRKIYKFVLMNGEVLYLSTIEAQQLLDNQQLLTNTSFDIPVLGRSYQVSNFQVFDKPLNTSGITEFGIEIKYNLNGHQDNRLKFVAEDFPVEIYEKSYRNKEGKLSKYFLIDVLLPNSIFKKNTKAYTIKGLEYFDQVVLTKSKDKNISILRSRLNNVNYNFIDFPPKVTNFTEDSVFLSFFSSYNQTVPVVAQQVFLDKEEKEKKRLISLDRQINPRSEFGGAYQIALDEVNQSFEIKEADRAVDKFLKAEHLIDNAANLAQNDTDFLKALKLKNKVKDNIYSLSISYVSEHITDEVQTPKLLKLLDYAYQATSNRKKLATIERYKNRLLHAQ